MKKILYLYFTIIISIFITSCDKNSNEFDILDQKLNQIKSEMNGEEIAGLTIFNITESQEIVIRVSTNNSLDNFNKSIVLAEIDPNLEASSIEFGYSRVIILDGLILIRLENGNINGLILGKANGAETLFKLIEYYQLELNNENSFIGYGLSHLTGDWKTVNNKIVSAFNYLETNTLLNHNSRITEENCTSGGPGSTKCSITEKIGPIETSCSVDCGSGYYACCKSSSVICYCVKEGEGDNCYDLECAGNFLKKN